VEFHVSLTTKIDAEAANVNISHNVGAGADLAGGHLV
jgi:hypothetical protein